MGSLSEAPFVEIVGRSVVSDCGPSATAHCVGTEAVKDLAAKGRSDKVGIPVEGGGGPSFGRRPCSCDLVKLEGDAISLCDLRHQGVQCVSVTQVGQKCMAEDQSA